MQSATQEETLDLQALPFDLLLKLIVIGDAGTGKSCLMHQFIQRRHDKAIPRTVGVEFGSRIVRAGGKTIKLQVWDTAGQERFRSVTRSYYRGAAGCLLVFDLTDRESFQNAGRWLRDVHELSSTAISVVLVGNKLDLVHERQVSGYEATRFAHEHQIAYSEASAATGEGVDECFHQLASAVLQKIEDGTLAPSDEVGSGVQIGGGVDDAAGREAAQWSCCAGLCASGARMWWPTEVEDWWTMAMA